MSSSRARLWQVADGGVGEEEDGRSRGRPSGEEHAQRGERGRLICEPSLKISRRHRFWGGVSESRATQCHWVGPNGSEMDAVGKLL